MDRSSVMCAEAMLFLRGAVLVMFMDIDSVVLRLIRMRPVIMSRGSYRACGYELHVNITAVAVLLL
jgi:hypothetical protein